MISAWHHGREVAVDPMDALGALARVKAGLGLPASVVPRIGRYEFLDFLGAGGFGRVYRARDPDLGREVAIKAIALAGLDRAHARRLARGEARVLARLSHPNVVRVFDVTSGRLPAAFDFATRSETDASAPEELFIVMELLDGQGLDEWLATPRSPDAVVATFVEAARGLAAAHRAGVLHRDFKPSNVMRTHDGRVVVLDFGVASLPRVRGEPLADITLPPSSVTLHSAAHVTGAGTPRYMAPEQHRREALTEATDVYAFGCSLYHGLYGRPPFEGESLRALYEHKLRGQPMPARPQVRPEVAEAVRRAIQADPERRFASMPQLLEALAPPPRRRSGRARLWIGAALFGAAGLALQLPASEPAGPPCGTQGQHEGEVLDASERHALADRLRDHALRHPGAVVGDLATAVEANVSQWAAATLVACEAAAHDHAREDRLHAARAACLGAWRRQLTATIDVISNGGSAAVSRAADLVSALPQPEHCADAHLAESRVPPPTDAQAPVVAAIRDVLMRADAQLRAGSRGDLAAAEAERSRAESLGYAPVLAEALLVTGRLLAHRSDVDEAHERLARAAWLALEFDDRATAREAFIELVRLDRPVDRVDETIEWAQRGRAQLEGAGDAISRVALDAALAPRLANAGRFEAALEAAQRAVELATASGPPRRVAQARARLSLAVVHVHRREQALAEAEARRAWAELGLRLGEHHPDTMKAAAVVAAALNATGRDAEADPIYEAVIRGHTLAYGPRSRHTAGARSNRAGALVDLERFAEARRELQVAIEIWEEGGFFDSLVYAYSTLSGLEVREGDVDAGRAALRRAWSIIDQTPSGQHSMRWAVALSRGRLERDHGAPSSARRWLERATSAPAPNPGLGATAWIELGELCAAQRDLAGVTAAVEGARRALASVPGQGDPQTLAALRDRLAALEVPRGPAAGDSG